MNTLYLLTITITVISILGGTAVYAEITSGPVLFMKSNSVGQIHANFTFRVLNNNTWNLTPSLHTGLSDPNPIDSNDLTIVASPNSIIANQSNVPVTFTITAKNGIKGIYSLFLHYCGESPLVVGLNESEISPGTLNQYFNAEYMCPAGTYDMPEMNIVGYSGMISKTISTIPSNANDIEIQDIQVQPHQIKVGDTFTINATLVNNSPNPIFLPDTACEGPFFVTFDNHVTVQQYAVSCAAMFNFQKLNPGEKITKTSIGSAATYAATTAGSTNATITFSYFINNETNSNSNYEKFISKSFLLTILDNNTKTKTIQVLSPLKQFKSGIAANDVRCKQDLQLVIKSEDGSPACVKPQTAQKFVERGWGWMMQPMDSLKSLLPNRIPGLENDTGLVTFGNHTYYFETPSYTNTAYSNSVQILFHDVLFTLFPPGFRGGLPTDSGCEGAITGILSGSGSYYWTDAKFPDGTHELLHIFGYSKLSCPVRSIPTYFSTHANPQVGLIFYDGKMKLLVNTNNPKLSYMNIKVYSSYAPGSLVDHFLIGNLYSAAGPIQNASITIAVNGLVMGTTETYPSGCFQFNNWNDSKLADQINKSRALGSSFTELNFQTQYFGDSNHNPVNASANSDLQFYAVPLAPAQYDTSLSPSSEINVTQGSSAKLQVTIKPFSKYWEVQHMKLGLQRTPCGITYDISPAENNGDSVLENHPGSFNVTLSTSNYTTSGRYWMAITQDTSELDNLSIDTDVGAFFLNVMKK